MFGRRDRGFRFAMQQRSSPVPGRHTHRQWHLQFWLGSPVDEQTLAETKAEFGTSALRFQGRLHFGRDLREHRSQQHLHRIVVTARPTLKFHLLVQLLFMGDGEATLL